MTLFWCLIDECGALWILNGISWCIMDSQEHYPAGYRGISWNIVIDMLSELNQTERDKNMIIQICQWRWIVHISGIITAQVLGKKLLE